MVDPKQPYRAQLSLKVTKTNGEEETVLLNSTLEWGNLDYRGAVELQGAVCNALLHMSECGRKCACEREAAACCAPLPASEEAASTEAAAA
jgi:hypothetical protein